MIGLTGPDADAWGQVGHLVWWVPYMVRLWRHPPPPERARAGWRAMLPMALHATLVTILWLESLAAAWGMRDLTLVTPGLRIAAIGLGLAGAWLLHAALSHLEHWRLDPALAPDHTLTTTGPYRRLRHPIYGAFLLWGVANWLYWPTPGLAVAVALLVPVTAVRCRQEERQLLDRYGDTYAAYMRQAGRWLPGPGPKTAARPP